MTAVRIEDIRIDGGTQSRVEIDNELVAEYAELMREGVKFPQIEVMHDGTTYWLVNGFHRWHAARRVGLPAIECEVYSGSLRDAQLASFGANADHGKRRTNGDKRKAVETMLADDEWKQWSDVQISKVCCVTREFVNRVRSNLTCDQITCDKPAERKYVNKHGQQTTMKVAKIGKKKAEAVKQIQTGTVEAKPAPTSDVPKIGFKKVEADDGAPEGYDYEADMAKMVQQIKAEHDEQVANFMLMLKGGDALAVAAEEIKSLNEEVVRLKELNATYELRFRSLNAQLNHFKGLYSGLKKKLGKDAA